VFANGQPWVGDGDVDQWLLILQKIAELRPEKIAPGHGPVTGPDMIDVMRRYLDALRNAAPDDPNPVPELAFPEMWERNVTALADRAA
jgi:cyclase